MELRALGKVSAPTGGGLKGPNYSLERGRTKLWVGQKLGPRVNSPWGKRFSLKGRGPWGKPV